MVGKIFTKKNTAETQLGPISRDNFRNIDDQIQSRDTSTPQLTRQEGYKQAKSNSDPRKGSIDTP